MSAEEAGGICAPAEGERGSASVVALQPCGDEDCPGHPVEVAACPQCGFDPNSIQKKLQEHVSGMESRSRAVVLATVIKALDELPIEIPEDGLFEEEPRVATAMHFKERALEAIEKVELGTDFIVMPREVLRDIVEGGQPGFEAIGQVRKFLMKIDADVKKASKEAKRVAHPH